MKDDNVREVPEWIRKDEEASAKCAGGNKNFLKGIVERFSKFFNEGEFLKKAAKFAKQIGLKGIYYALILFYTYKKETTPVWAKRVVLGVIGYFIAPLDFIPDFTPLLGFSDDLFIIVMAMGVLACCIDEDARLKARVKLNCWFGNIDQEVLDRYDKEVSKEETL